MERATLAVILLAVIVVLGFSIFSNTGITQAAEKNTIADVMVKLDEVIKNQQEILGNFNKVMEELRIIKIRATKN
ncbi:MAG: hypothetical protein ABH843_02640 [Candidatus Omnitrophota bacterium]